jgi:hypothetical protein
MFAYPLSHENIKFSEVSALPEFCVSYLSIAVNKILERTTYKEELFILA